MFKNTYTIISYFFHRCVFSKNLVDTNFGYRELWLQLVGIFQQYFFVLAYHLSCHILHLVLLNMGWEVLPLPLLSMSFLLRRGVVSAYPMTSSCCLPLCYPEPHVSLACHLLLPGSSQSLSAVNSIALCIAYNPHPFSLFSNPISSSNPLFLCCPMTAGTSPAWRCLRCCIRIQQQRSAFLQVQCHLPQPA